MFKVARIQFIGVIEKNHMPIYEYTCRKCKAHIEAMQKISDKPLARCRKCGGKLEKEWSQTSFQLKGSGWYVTDYASKKSEAKESDAKEPDVKATDTKEAKAKGREAATSDSASRGDSASDSADAKKKKSPTSKSSSTPPSTSNTSGD